MTWIDEIIQGLFDLYGTYDPFELCEHLEMSLREIDAESPMLNGQSSIYIRHFFKQECILYASGLRFLRLKFILLHEIGHALLHPDIACSRLTNKGKLEAQANYFARKMILLINGPEETIERFAKVNDIPLDVFRDVI